MKILRMTILGKGKGWIVATTWNVKIGALYVEPRALMSWEVLAKRTTLGSKASLGEANQWTGSSGEVPASIILRMRPTPGNEWRIINGVIQSPAPGVVMQVGQRTSILILLISENGGIYRTEDSQMREGGGISPETVETGTMVAERGRIFIKVVRDTKVQGIEEMIIKPVTTGAGEELIRGSVLLVRGTDGRMVSPFCRWVN